MELIWGDCLEVLKTLEDNSIDSLVTDPPAGIAFMNKSWDSDKGGRDHWITWMSEIMSEALRVMKPGAHGLVWALPRASHWTATALENSGFEIRDIVMHLFGTGFPKSLNISKAIDKTAGAEREVIGVRTEHNIKGSGENSRLHNSSGKRETIEINITKPATNEAKQWDGWGTALKPACEHWILIRKPLSEKTVAKNVLKWGCGAINIEVSRVLSPDIQGQIRDHKGKSYNNVADGYKRKNKSSYVNKTNWVAKDQGRFPANLTLDDYAAEMLDEQSGQLKSGSIKKEQYKKGKKNSVYGKYGGYELSGDLKASQGGASRFFYCAKASKSERGENNNHPTVKALKLMKYLINMITPPNGVVLDPFMGSGSTGVACKDLGFKFLGIEKETEYFNISEKRIEATHGS